MAGNKNSGRKKINTSNMPKKRLTTTEAANMMGLSADTIRKCADMGGGIPYIRIFQNRWFIESEVREWFAKHKTNIPKQEGGDDGTKT